MIFCQQGDLGAIDEKYDVAISSSCGALDHIVVDTIDTAQKCVNFLKKQNIGVATFIALDKVCMVLICSNFLVIGGFFKFGKMILYYSSSQ